jgi:YggT family protein
VSLLFWALYALISLFILTMWVRVVYDFFVTFNRGWRPRGAALVLAEVVYTVTDPPIKFVRRFVPPLRFGGIAIDLAWTIVMIVAFILSYVCSGFLI